MELSFYQAECGDAARIKFLGNDGLFHHIMIDSGYERTFRYVLLEEIKTIFNKGEKIDLWVISHIHDDHIGGVLKYIESIESGEVLDIVDNWFYNPPRKYLDSFYKKNANTISYSKSIRQGDKLFEYIREKSTLVSFDISNELEEQDFFGMKIKILSPSNEKMRNLRTKYNDNNLITFERSEIVSISNATRSKNNDYLKKLDDFDLLNWTEDYSVENGSSISMITELNGIKILWLADSHPSVVISSLKKMGYSSTNKLKCHLVKVAHHGSLGNNSILLYGLIECENYLMSVNGENIHNLPTKESMAIILKNDNRDVSLKYFFYFTYDNPLLRSIFAVDGSEIFERWNFGIIYLRNQKSIKVNF
jgi:beta-lactamase superfamily II metal-dependent hydrolase